MNIIAAGGVDERIAGGVLQIIAGLGLLVVAFFGERSRRRSASTSLSSDLYGWWALLGLGEFVAGVWGMSGSELS